MKTLTIAKKMSNSGSIHDIASDLEDREIKFRKGTKFAIVLASYYGGKGYRTFATAEAAAKASLKEEASHVILDSDGNGYEAESYSHELRLVCLAS